MPTPAEIDQAIQAAAAQNNLPPDLFRKQLQAESNLNPAATGAGGELGIAQFTPDTAKAFGIDPLDYKQAIPAAALYMRQNLNRFGGDYTKALAAYNWGPGNVATKGVANLPPVTQAYIQKIMGPGGAGQAVGAPPDVGSTLPVPPVPPAMAAPGSGVTGGEQLAAAPQAPAPAMMSPGSGVTGGETLADTLMKAGQQITQGPVSAALQTAPPPMPPPMRMTSSAPITPMFQMQVPSAPLRQPTPAAAPAPPPATPAWASQRQVAPAPPAWTPPPAAPNTALSGVIMRALRGY